MNKQVQTSTNKYKQVSLFLLYFLILKPLLAQPPASPLHNPLQFVNQQLLEIFTPLSRPNKASGAKTINTIIDLEKSTLPSGMYFIIISNGEEQLINKLIKN